MSLSRAEITKAETQFLPNANPRNIALDPVKIATVLALTGLVCGMLNSKILPFKPKRFHVHYSINFTASLWEMCLFFEMTFKYIYKRTLQVSAKFFSLSANTLPFKNQQGFLFLYDHISKLQQLVNVRKLFMCSS